MKSVSNDLIKVPCTKVVQNNVEFLVGTISAINLIQLVSVTHRSIIGFDDEGLPIYNDEIQRKPSNSRVKSIKDYLLTDKYATFPNNILISIPSLVLEREIEYNEGCDNFSIYIDKTKIDLSSSEYPMYLQIFDGQHRFKGMQEAIEECRNNNLLDLKENLENFNFVVSFFIDAEIDFQAMLFSVINRTPVKVSQDLVFDLFGLTENDSPQKTALAITLELNGKKYTEDNVIGPFYKRIRLLAKKEKGFNSPLSQGMVIKEIVKLISPSLQIAERERFLSREKFVKGGNSNTIFRDFYSQNKDFAIFKTLLNFFTAVRETFVDENNNKYWDFEETPDNPLQRTIGFLAFMKILVIIFPEGLTEKNLSKEFFLKKLKPAKELHLIDSNGDSLYPYSSVGVNRLRDDVLNLILN